MSPFSLSSPFLRMSPFSPFSLSPLSPFLFPFLLRMFPFSWSSRLANGAGTITLLKHFARLGSTNDEMGRGTVRPVAGVARECETVPGLATALCGQLAGWQVGRLARWPFGTLARCGGVRRTGVRGNAIPLRGKEKCLARRFAMKHRSTGRVLRVLRVRGENAGIPRLFATWTGISPIISSPRGQYST